MIYINHHEVTLDANESLTPWMPLSKVVWLAMDFIKRCPVEPHNGLPWYLQYSCFWTDPIRPTIWPDNPAGKFAWAMTTLAHYYPYSGDDSHIGIVRQMLDQLIKYQTPGHFAWSHVPYASAEPGTGIYFGARADGHYATEPDKVAQAAGAYVDFYEMTGEEKYLEAAIRAADTLVKWMRPGDADHSPWPFRIDARNGAVVEEYTADMIPMIRLFSELTRLGEARFRSGHDAAWEWLFRYPLRNNVWKGYFEDIRLDPQNGNRDQLSPLETARYLLDHPELDPDWRVHVPALIEWVQKTLGSEPFYGAVPIHEQKYCFHVMASHTARFASLCARWAQISGNSYYRELALRTFYWTTYLAHDDGVILMGIDRPDYYNQCWFTDSYFDFVPHCIEGMAAIPELAPADSDHLLRSTSIICRVEYQPLRICYHTFYAHADEVLRVTFAPSAVFSGGEKLIENSLDHDSAGWSYEPDTGVLRIHHTSPDVEVSGW